jgi:hypothetical protein
LVTALSQVINAYAGDLSNRAVAARSHGALSQGTVQKYRAGTHPVDPADWVLRAFSDTLGAPLAELHRAAGTPSPLGEWVPPPEAHHMSREQRDLITALIKMLVRGAGGSNPGQAVVVVKGPAGSAAKAEGRRRVEQDG